MGRKPRTAEYGRIVISGPLEFVQLTFGITIPLLILFVLLEYPRTPREVFQYVGISLAVAVLLSWSAIIISSAVA